MILPLHEGLLTPELTTLGARDRRHERRGWRQLRAAEAISIVPLSLLNAAAASDYNHPAFSSRCCAEPAPPLSVPASRTPGPLAASSGVLGGPSSTASSSSCCREARPAAARRPRVRRHHRRHRRRCRCPSRTPPRPRPCRESRSDARRQTAPTTTPGGERAAAWRWVQGR